VSAAIAASVAIQGGGCASAAGASPESEMTGLVAAFWATPSGRTIAGFEAVFAGAATLSGSLIAGFEAALGGGGGTVFVPSRELLPGSGIAGLEANLGTGGGVPPWGVAIAGFDAAFGTGGTVFMASRESLPGSAMAGLEAVFAGAPTPS